MESEETMAEANAGQPAATNTAAPRPMHEAGSVVARPERCLASRAAPDRDR